MSGRVAVEVLGEGTETATRSCREPGCDRPVKARGFCNTHYCRYRIHGRFELRSYTRRPPGDSDGIDEIAVQRAVNGDPPDTLTRQERREAVRILRRCGLSYSQIATRLRTYDRQVYRDLFALGLVGLSAGFPVEQGRSA